MCLCISLQDKSQVRVDRDEMLDFMFKCHEVVEMIMECFARGLGLKDDFFKDVRCHSYHFC